MFYFICVFKLHLSTIVSSRTESYKQVLWNPTHWLITTHTEPGICPVVSEKHVLTVDRIGLIFILYFFTFFSELKFGMGSIGVTYFLSRFKVPFSYAEVTP
jgi:hypothetical protein